MTEAKFNGLADSYERVRPRYPSALLTFAVRLTGVPASVVDTGAGTGIALEALLPLLSPGTVVDAVDISTDMVRIGRDKFPSVRWHVGGAESFLEGRKDVDLVLAAQAYQWMDRPRFLRAARAALRPGGVCAVVQNNRHHEAGGFIAEYEELLEKYSPGYGRHYRAIDVVGEFAQVFAEVQEQRETWEQSMTVEEFVTMSSSSTQAQRAISSIGPSFLDHVRDLARGHERDGRVRIPYVSEGFYGIAGQ